METRKRGYLLIGEEDFLEPYRQARRSFEGDLEQVRRLDGRAETSVEPGTLDDLQSQHETILAPSSDMRVAMASPRPFAPPVTIATLPDSRVTDFSFG